MCSKIFNINTYLIFEIINFKIYIFILNCISHFRMYILKYIFKSKHYFRLYILECLQSLKKGFGLSYLKPFRMIQFEINQQDNEVRGSSLKDLRISLTNIRRTQQMKGDG